MSIEEHSETIKSLKREIENLDSEYELSEQEVADIAAELNKLRERLDLARDRKQTLYFNRLDKKNQLDNTERRVAKMRQEEAERLQKEPDLSNPPLEKILSVVTEWPEWTKLRDYQKADLIFSWDRFLRPEVSHQWGIFNSNDTSLGKTAETAITIRGLRVLYPDASVLWLTKSSLVKTSSRQCVEWGLPVIPLVGSSDTKAGMMDFMGNTLRAVGMPETYITNYEALNTSLMKKIEERNWLCVVVDEMHRLRGGANAGGPTKMWLGLKKVLHGTDSFRVVALPPMKPLTNDTEIIDGIPQGRPFPIFLSGSLINNGSEEIWAYVHLFNPISFPSKQHFKRTFLSLSGFISTELIIRAIATNFFRKTKKEIGLFMHELLPPMEHIIELVPGSDLYNFQKEVVEDFMIKLDGMGDEVVSIAGILAELHYARLSLVAQDFNVSVPLRDAMGYVMKDEMTGKVLKKKVPKHLNPPVSKLEYAAEHIFELVMGDRENVLVFSAQFNTPIVWLMEKLRSQGIKCDAITGDSRITKSDAGDIEVDFQQNNLQVLFLNMKSGAEGLNLHKDKRWPGGSSHVVMLDRWWNPAIEKQAIDRAWRLDCLEPVTVHRYSVDNSVDQIMEGIINEKIAEAEGITEHSGLRASEWRSKIHGWLNKRD